MKKQNMGATSASFTSGLLEAAARYTERPSVDMSKLNAVTREKRREAGTIKMALNNARMKAEAAEKRRNPDQTEMFG